MSRNLFGIEVQTRLASPRLCLLCLSAVQYITIELIWLMAGQVRCTIYTRGIWYIWLSDTRPNKLTLFINAWYFINNTNVDRKAITALATQANLFIIVFADAVRRIGNVASGKWKEKQQQTNKIKRQTATRQFWNRNRNRNRGAINSAISAHKTYLCSSALNYVNTFAANWVVSLSLCLAVAPAALHTVLKHIYGAPNLNL